MIRGTGLSSLPPLGAASQLGPSPLAHDRLSSPGLTLRGGCAGAVCQSTPMRSAVLEPSFAEAMTDAVKRDIRTPSLAGRQRKTRVPAD